MILYCLNFRDIPENTVVARQLSVYEGVYGNFAYGNVTITINDTTSRLQMFLGHMGKWDLYPSTEEDTFIADGIEHTWPMNLRGTHLGSMGTP